MTYGIHWFRRDLRVAGNPALQWSWREHKSRVVGFFCFDKVFLSRPDFSVNRFGFFLDTLAALRDELRSVGSDLLVFDIGPQDAFERLFETLKAQSKELPQTVSFNRDYEPFARARDSTMSETLSKRWGVSVHTERDHVLIEPEEISKDKNKKDFYQVYSPFARRWFEFLATSEGQSRVEAQRSGLEYLRAGMQGKVPKKLFNLNWAELLDEGALRTDSLNEYREQNSKKLTVKMPEAGSLAALRRLEEYSKEGLERYDESRDFPAIDGTSRLSLYFKNGSLTPAQVIAFLGLEGLTVKGKDSHTKFLKEIVWREFYYHILYHCPHVEHRAFLEKYVNLQWDDNEDHFRVWKQGLTGYPIVDAGMRQLSQTGWMHNRVRMIVASFLTKDLHLNWQWGERYFMEQLLDGDLAPNNGGWQWAASTGCDPQPYFRVFNPTLQGQKFDPQGEYVRKFVPELREVPDRYIHEPHQWGGKISYPQPMVDHKLEKGRALRMYSQA